MKFTDWFRQWMQEHPLGVPSEDDSRRFTQDVMRQIRADIMPAHAPQPDRAAWSGWRLAVALPAITVATTLVVVALLYFTRNAGPDIAETPPPVTVIEQVAPIQVAHAATPSVLDEAENIVAILTALNEDLTGDLPTDTLTEALRWIDEDHLSS